MYVLEADTLPASARSLMENKTILVVGNDQISWVWIRSTLKNYGIKLVLVVSESVTFSQDAFKCIQYDFSDHSLDEIHAEEIINILLDLNLNIDGCCTFTDECGPLTAYLCEKLTLSGGVGVPGATNVRDKSRTHSYLRQQTDGYYNFPLTYNYTGRSTVINSENTLQSAIQTIGFPAVCKPEHGANGKGVMMFWNKEEYEDVYQKLENTLKDGHSIMLMEYFDGTEHDIEVIIYQGEVLAAIVSDNGPTMPGSFVETSMSMPSCLSPSDISKLRTAASDCCIDIGLRNGVFNVEMKLTSVGPKLIEINGRMGGDYIRNWMHICYGFDLLWYVVVIAAGIRPPIPTVETTVHMMGVTCALPVHEKLLCYKEFGAKVDQLIQSRQVHFFGEKFVESKSIPTKNAVAICNIAVVKPDLVSAKSSLLDICDLLDINTTLFHVPTYLSDFAPTKV
ncbi:carnosine synthase 1-like [Ylistrum balloti]|uniref:carnosine synthase 1-like n=1 Tax=Ylistrum balloti TaxID=509963 RepID=UPI002905CBB1|nr:carnosine synthase 1-like [Ylistrum balloti]